jgi:hypothetical protein
LSDDESAEREQVSIQRRLEQAALVVMVVTMVPAAPVSPVAISRVVGMVETSVEA